MRPYQCLIAFFGLTPPPFLVTTKWQHLFPLKLGYRLYEACLFVITLYATYLNNDTVEFAVGFLELDSITSVLSVGLNIFVVLVQLTMQIFSVFGVGELREILQNIAQIEMDMKKYSWSACNMDYFKRKFGLQFQLATRSLVLFLFLVFFLPYINFYLTSGTMTYFERLVSITSCLFVQIKCVEYCVVVQVVQELLHCLQEDLKLLRAEIVRCKPVTSQHFCAALQQNQQLLARVWKLVHSVERYFWVPILLLFLYNGLAITHNANWAYTNFYMEQELYNMYRILFTFTIFGNMMLPAYLCQSCIDSYHYFGALLHSMKTCSMDVALSMRLREYSLQLMQQELRFSCGGFFDINLGFFGKLVLTVSTYVVILIQFKMQSHVGDVNKSKDFEVFIKKA